jgi:N-acetyl-alpha-D-muramate 1-phosphate uridylyltransferase
MTWHPDKAMVLAAGLGTRMQPLTRSVPKPMVALGGKPLIDHVLDRIAESEIGTAVVNVHHHADVIEKHLRTRETPRIIVSDERKTLLDTGGGVKKCLPQLGREPFLIHNSDSLWVDGIEDNIARLARNFDPERMDSLMLVASGVSSVGYDGRGDFLLAPDGLLRRRPERELTPFAFAGVSIAHPRMFENTPDGPFSLNLVWDRAIEQGRLYGLRLDGIWMHLGTPTALTAAERLLAGEETV